MTIAGFVLPPGAGGRSDCAHAMQTDDGGERQPLNTDGSGEGTRRTKPMRAVSQIALQDQMALQELASSRQRTPSLLGDVDVGQNDGELFLLRDISYLVDPRQITLARELIRAITRREITPEFSRACSARSVASKYRSAILGRTK